MKIKYEAMLKSTKVIIGGVSSEKNKVVSIHKIPVACLGALKNKFIIIVIIII